MESVPIMLPPKRIAICLSGQIRSWKKCIDSWELIYKHFPNAQVDYFIHTWDENSYPAKFGNTKETVKISQEEIDELTERLKPKKMIFEKAKSFSSLKNNAALDSSPYLSQYYGVLKCARLKKQYEIENDFVYDIVVRLRFDLFINQPIFRDPYFQIQERMIYGIHYGYDFDRRCFRFGDMFFFSDSMTYDILSEYYYGVHLLPDYWFDSSIPPEFAWHYYFKNNNIDLFINYWDVKLMRQSEDHLLSKDSNYEIF